MSLNYKWLLVLLTFGFGFMAQPSLALDTNSMAAKAPLVQGSKDEAEICAAVITYTLNDIKDGAPTPNALNAEEIYITERIASAWIIEAADKNALSETEYTHTILRSDSKAVGHVSFKTRKFYISPCVARGKVVALELGLDLTPPKSPVPNP